MARGHKEPLSKKEMAKRFCYGVVITSVWVCTNGALWFGIDQFRQRIKLVEDYGAEFMLDPSANNQMAEGINWFDQQQDQMVEG